LAQPSKIIVGLGNPGADYSFNRHNIGFMAADALAEAAHATAWQKKMKGTLATATLAGHTFLLLKPMTFMNLSGESVGEVARYYKIAPADIIVIHDDIDLMAGQIKAKIGGGNGGHNGLKSIDAHIGKDYWRVRLGVGRPEHKTDVVNFVLGNFSKEDQKTWLLPLLGALPEALPLLLEGESSKFLQALQTL